MSVYFVQSGEAGPIKIGHAVNVAKRMDGLRTGSHEQLNLLGMMDGGREVEQKIHIQFYNERLRGEWFEASDRLLQFIRDNATLTVEARLSRKEAVNLHDYAPTPLRDWMIQEGVDVYAFADAISRHSGSVRRLLEKKVRPGRLTIANILEATGGAIGINHFADYPVQPKRQRRMRIRVVPDLTGSWPLSNSVAA